MEKRLSWVICKDKLGVEYRIPKELLQFRIGVCGILTRNNSVLLIRDHTTAKLELPGGAVEKGESLESALIREFGEETGLQVEIERLLTYKESFFFMKNPDIPFQTIRLFFSVRAISPKNVITGGEFIDIAELTQNNTAELTYSTLKELFLKK